MLAICAGIAVGFMVARGGNDGNRTGGTEASASSGVPMGLPDLRVDELRSVRDEGEGIGSGGDSPAIVAPTRLVIPGLATADEEAEVTAAAVEPTRDIVEPTVQVPLTVQPSGNPGVFAPADIIALIVQYDWPDDTAIAIANCESGFDPNAYNASSGASGIYQFLGRFHNWKLRAGETWFDASANIRIAYETWLADGGFSAWAASRHCWGN